MKPQRLRQTWRARAALFTLLLLGTALLSHSTANAASTLTIAPITWNVIGLDSNSPTSGPYRFPVGARVCSSVATTNVAVNLVWDSSNSNIDFRPGSQTSITIGSIAAGSCSDAYFEVQVNQVAGAYDTTRRYHITATDASGTVSTPTPRELYIEHLISQNRNGITDIKLNGTSIPAGGTMTLMVGGTYSIELDGFTATQGYNQLESFINFPNTIFQILSVSTTYSADSNTTNVPNPSSQLYANACIWDTDPGSPTYRSCIGGDDKAGGTVVVTYSVKIIGGAGTSQTLNTLLYDFSGSSFHYNADLAAGARIASIVSPSSVTIQKAFTPKAIAPGGTSTMTFKLTNPTTQSFTGVNFADSLPSGLVVSGTPGVTYSGCGAGAFSPALTGSETSISFVNGTLSANSICTITVNVTAASAGTYSNTSGDLFINTSIDTGNTGSDTLTASSAPACTPNQTLVHWIVPSTATNPPDLSGGLPTTQGANVSAAVASSFPSGKSGINTTTGSNDSYSWDTYGYKNGGGYVQFAIDTRHYSGVSMTLYSKRDSNGPTDLSVYFDNGGGLTLKATLNASSTPPYDTTWRSYTLDFTGNTSTTGTTTFRISGTGALNDNSGADAYFDDITFTGCSIPAPAPTITKSFLPTSIAEGSTSTLTFTLDNTAAGNQALTGVAFTDVLPAGLSVADSTSSQCGGSNNLTTTAATRTIALTGGSLAAGASCTFNVTVTGTTEGQYNNVTGFISSAQSGTSTNYATASLTVIAPPVLAKSFSPTSIFTGNTSTLSFTVTNPNISSSLSGIGFTDTLPAGLTVATGGPTAPCGVGSSLTTIAPNTVSFSVGSLAANSSCTFSVTVTGVSAGTWNNTTTAITSTQGGNGNTASASLVVNDQTAAIDLTKQVSTAGTNPWTSFIGVAVGGNVYYKFKVYNSGELPFTALSVSDPTLAGKSVDPATCNWTASLPLAPGDTAYCVKGPISATTGLNANTATAQGTYASGTKTSSPSTASYGTTGLTIAKSVAESSFSTAGDTLHYSYVVTNSGSASLIGPVTVTDDKATANCPAVSTVGNLDNWLNPGESITCTATYTVTAGDVTVGNVTNSAYATADGVTSNTDSKAVQLQNTPTDTPTNTPTVTDTPTGTPTDTPTNTPTNTSTNTPTDTPTDTPTNTPTNTSTNTPTNTPTNTSTNTPTDTPTNTSTNTPTSTPTNTPTGTPTNTPTSTPTNPPTGRADLQLIKTGVIGTGGIKITFMLRVTNLGPDAAANVVLRDPLPREVQYVSSVWIKGKITGACVLTGKLVTCNLGTLARVQTATVTVRTTLVQPVQVFKNIANVTSAARDPVLRNNTSGVLIQLGQPPGHQITPLQASDTNGGTESSDSGSGMSAGNPVWDLLAWLWDGLGEGK